jgi:hypothetical protein
MLVPVRGGIENLQKRNRPILAQQAALATIDIPAVYIFNVGPRVWRGAGGGREWVIPACPKGARHSVAVEIPMLNVSEMDPADGANNMGVVIDAGVSGQRKIGGEMRQVMGVADDIIGKNSTSPALELYTTNGEWFGVFVSTDPEPSDEEIETAEAKLREMMQLIYSQGAEKVQAGERVVPVDRKRYNEAAEYLHVKPLWGNLDHTMDACPLCGEDIRKGARVCKHCQRPIDEASVRAFFLKQERELEEMLAGQEPGGEDAEANAAADESEPEQPRGRTKSRKASEPRRR